jgi:hypothetical protein
MELSKSYQDEHIKKQRGAWLPTPLQSLIYMGCGLFLVLLVHRDAIVSTLSGESLQSLGGLSFLSQNENYYLDNLFALPFLGTIAVLAFWAALGCTLYCLAWGVSTTLGEAVKYEKLSETAVMPAGQTKQKFWASSFANVVLLISSVFMFALLLAVAVGYILPVSEQLLVTILSTPLTVKAWFAVVVFMAAVVLIGQGVSLTIHTLNYARRVIFF